MTPVDKALEAAARAECPAPPDDMCEALCDACRSESRKVVAAFLRALEPTPEMVEACLVRSTGPDESMYASIWRAMASKLAEQVEGRR